jgi:hypothetical protein
MRQRVRYKAPSSSESRVESGGLDTQRHGRQFLSAIWGLRPNDYIGFQSRRQVVAALRKLESRARRQDIFRWGRSATDRLAQASLLCADG